MPEGSLLQTRKRMPLLPLPPSPQRRPTCWSGQSLMRKAPPQAARWWTCLPVAKGRRSVAGQHCITRSIAPNGGSRCTWSTLVQIRWPKMTMVSHPCDCVQLLSLRMNLTGARLSCRPALTLSATTMAAVKTTTTMTMRPRMLPLRQSVVVCTERTPRGWALIPLRMQCGSVPSCVGSRSRRS